MNLPSSGAVIGVDVGFSPTRRSSAVCRLDWNETYISMSVERFRAIEPERTNALGRACDRPLLAAAFDGPLRGDLQVIGRYRAAERMLTRQLGRVIGKPGQSSAPVGKDLNLHANECAKAVIGYQKLAKSQHKCAIHELAIVEAFPSSFMGLMLEDPRMLDVRRGDRSDRYFVHLVETGGLKALLSFLLPGRKLQGPLENVTDHDERAGVICAISALCVAQDQFVAVGDSDGWIILPPKSFIQQWAWPKLESNCSGGGLIRSSQSTEYPAPSGELIDRDQGKPDRP